jgi:hypothetical protein
MSRDDDLRDLLDSTARDLDRLAGNPRTWLSWIVYLLGRLETEATDVDPANKAAFIDMLTSLQDEIRNRLRTGGWN